MSAASHLLQRVQVHAATELLDISLPSFPTPLTLFSFPFPRTIVRHFIVRPMKFAIRFVGTIVNVFQLSSERPRTAYLATIVRRIYGALALRIVHDNGTRTRPLLLRRFLCRNLSRPLFHLTYATSSPSPSPCSPVARQHPNSRQPAQRTSERQRPTP